MIEAAVQVTEVNPPDALYAAVWTRAYISMYKSLLSMVGLKALIG
jgi:hypothetical protein